MIQFYVSVPNLALIVDRIEKFRAVPEIRTLKREPKRFPNNVTSLNEKGNHDMEREPRRVHSSNRLLISSTKQSI